MAQQSTVVKAHKLFRRTVSAMMLLVIAGLAIWRGGVVLNCFLFLLIFTESTPHNLIALKINGKTFVFNLGNSWFRSDFKEKELEDTKHGDNNNENVVKNNKMDTGDDDNMNNMNLTETYVLKTKNCFFSARVLRGQKSI